MSQLTCEQLEAKITRASPTVASTNETTGKLANLLDLSNQSKSNRSPTAAQNESNKIIDFSNEKQGIITTHQTDSKASNSKHAQNNKHAQQPNRNRSKTESPRNDDHWQLSPSEQIFLREMQTKSRSASPQFTSPLAGRIKLASGHMSDAPREGNLAKPVTNLGNMSQTALGGSLTGTINDRINNEVNNEKNSSFYQDLGLAKDWSKMQIKILDRKPPVLEDGATDKLDMISAGNLLNEIKSEVLTEEAFLARMMSKINVSEDSTKSAKDTSKDNFETSDVYMELRNNPAITIGLNTDNNTKDTRERYTNKQHDLEVSTPDTKRLVLYYELVVFV